MSELSSSVWSRFSVDPRTPEAAALRAGDVDRNVVLEALREAYVEGRLDPVEHDRRTDLAVALVMVSDAVPLLADLLPGDVQVHGTAPPAVREQAAEKFRRESRDARNGWLGVTAITTTIWGAVAIGSGEMQYFWPIWPSLGVGVGFVMHRLNREQRIEALEEEIAARRRRIEG